MRLWSFLLSLLLLSTFCPSDAIASEQKVVLPIFFATDRPLNQDQVNQLDYTNGQNAHGELNFGVKNIVLTQPCDIDSQRILGLGWWCYNSDDTHAKPAVANKTLTQSEFLSNLKSIVEEGPADRPLFVYLNGCCCDFKGSTEQAARLAYLMQAPVLLYAWAAVPPTMEKYRENEDRENHGIQRFYQFLDELAQVIPPQKTVLVGYSMGNRFLYEALRERYWQHGKNVDYPKYRCTSFACADVDVDKFVADEPGVAFNSDQTFVTKNDTDKALIMSQIQRGLYGRLGAPRTALNKLLGTDRVDVLDIQNLYLFSHDFPGPVLSDAIRGLYGGIQPKYLFLQKKNHLKEVQRL